MLQGPHAPCFSRAALVIVAENVKNSVDEQHTDLGRERAAPAARLAGSGFQGDDDVAENRCVGGTGFALAQRKGKDVRRPVLASVLAVELLHLRVADQADTELGSEFSELAEDGLRIVADRNGADTREPAPFEDGNVGLGPLRAVAHEGLLLSARS
jgi:hypothetical protein